MKAKYIILKEPIKTMTRFISQTTLW